MDDDGWFLNSREWRHFNFEPRVIKFVGAVGKKDPVIEVTLPQFSAAAVPKVCNQLVFNVCATNFLFPVFQDDGFCFEAGCCAV